jgi:hypothetical protein
VLSGNDYGVEVASVAGAGNTIQGNLIGTNPGGTAGIPNLFGGVRLNGNGATLGGSVAGAGNLVAFNDGPGVEVSGASAGKGTGNAILGNSIHSNSELGIDLVFNGNANQPAPAIAFAVTGSTIVEGTITSTPSSTFRLEFFANPTCDTGGAGEGQTYLGFVNATTDGAGTASYRATLTTNAPVGQVVTATATNTATNNTSEFSACATVGTAQTLEFAAADVAVTEAAGTATVTVRRSGGTTGAISAGYATSDGTATAPGDYAPAQDVLTWAAGDGADKSFTVTIVNDLVSELAEIINLALSNLTGPVALGTQATSTITITDDDAAAATTQSLTAIFRAAASGW